MNKNYSVLMSVYNKEKPQHLIEAIDSMLNQTVKPDEFVIIKDGKLTDELDLAIAQYQKENKDLFHIVENQENLGLGRSLAIGVQACKNEYIARMDSDDISKIDRCEKELKILNENDEIDVVGSMTLEFIDEISNVISYREMPEEHDQICDYAKKRNPCVHPSIMMKKSKVLLAGNYRDYLYFEDYDLWIRMIEEGCKFYNIQEVLLYTRIDDNFYKRRGRIKVFKKNDKI